MTTNPDIRYIFASWNGFAERLTQIFRDPKVTIIAEQKL